jgi:hypothetical protein
MNTPLIQLNTLIQTAMVMETIPTELEAMFSLKTQRSGWISMEMAMEITETLFHRTERNGTIRMVTAMVII